jgi:predicted transcriptional regulator
MQIEMDSDIVDFLEHIVVFRKIRILYHILNIKQEINSQTTNYSTNLRKFMAKYIQQKEISILLFIGY